MIQGSQVLAPLSLPLKGHALIEASAGTGKTYTLAMLYLRLILNHGGSSALGEPLLPHNILVVTFTKAATQELRDRIRLCLWRPFQQSVLCLTASLMAGAHAWPYAIRSIYWQNRFLLGQWP